MNKFTIAIIIVIAAFFAFKFFATSKENFNEITAIELKEAQKNNEKFLLVDVREASERAVNKIKNSEHLKLGKIRKEFQKTFPNVKKDDKIILYCRSGRRSETAALMLQDQGYTNVHSLKGGIIKYLSK